MRFRYLKTRIAVSSLALWPILSSCGSTNVREDKGNPAVRTQAIFSGERAQCYGIINGVSVNDYAEVVLLLRKQGPYIVSRCTGTFVSDRTVITAAHCVSASESGDMLALIEDCSGKDAPQLVESTAVYHHGFSAEDFAAAEQKNQANSANDIFKLDLAILTFPEGTGSNFRAIAAKPVQEGDEVHFVGYGIQYAPDHALAEDEVDFSAIVKREGRNTITDRAMELAAPSDNIGILFNRNEALSKEPGTYSTIAQGDSGGPLFFDDDLVGITSTGSIVELEGNTHDVGFFTDLRSKDSQRLLKKAVGDGATIEGFEAYLDSL